jgi:hypothetical protein
MRKFTFDRSFNRVSVFKTPFNGDVARIYLRPDNMFIIQVAGSFRPCGIKGHETLTTLLSLASNILDDWDSFKG